MNLRVVVRFALVLFGGVVLVWIFGVDADEGLLGKRKERIAVDDGGARTTIPGAGTSRETDVALTDAVIPVREELEDQPGVLVQKYSIHIGRTESAGAKKMPAEKVRIDIYNKKPPPEERQIARVHGDVGTLYFATAPDAAAGFRDAAVHTMTLERNVLVEYLDEEGEVVTTMRSERLDLAESSFDVPDRARIEQVGMTIEGDGLHYDKSSGSFSLDRNVVVTGTRFGLPEAAAEDAREEDRPEDVTPSVKTIRCKGRFSFVPAEDDPDAPARGDDEQLATLGGGLLTFREEVVGSQDDSELRCDELEITLEDVPPSTPGGKGTLEVTNVLAKGTPSSPAILTNPQGTLVGETLHLVETEDGQIVTLDGRPEIRDAAFGGDSGEGATTFDAGARSRIVVRPRPAPADEPAPGGDDVATDSSARVLELRDDAFLETNSADAGKRFRIEGHAIDLEFGERAVAAADPGAPPEKELRLERLVGTGDARGEFAGGTFRGDVVLAVPVTAEDGTSNFAVTVSPNPTVTIVEPATESRPETRVTIESKDGTLTYTPPAGPDDPTRAVFLAGAEPVDLRVEEGGRLTTTLLAHRSIEVDLGAGEDALRALVATGDVSFRSVDQGVTGDGERLRLLPAGQGKRKFALTGAPATARLEDDAKGRREVMAPSIGFDPETGELLAEGGFEATVAGLAIAGDDGPMGGAAGDAAPGQLSGRRMRLTTRKSDGSTLLHATGDVRFEEPERDLVATSDRLDYDEATGLAELRSDGDTPASVTRSSPAQDGAPPETVGVTGPLILLAQETGTLTCPDRGVVTLLRPAHAGQSEIRVVARSRGPVRYRSARSGAYLNNDSKDVPIYLSRAEGHQFALLGQIS